MILSALAYSSQSLVELYLVQFHHLILVAQLKIAHVEVTLSVEKSSELISEAHKGCEDALRLAHPR